MSSKHCKKEPDITRRKFLSKTASTCALAAGAGLWGYVSYSEEPIRRKSERIYTFKSYQMPASKDHPSMVITRGNDVQKMAAAAVDKLGSMSRFINPGDRVLIKPNVGWDRQPEQAANTSPVLVGAVVDLCRKAGASEVWVTDVSINDPYRSFARSGIEEAVQKSGGRIRFTTQNDFVLTDLKGKALQVWPVSRFYHEVDKVINLPIVKHHSLSGCTIAMKNWYGVLGGRRNRLHQDINTSIADLAATGGNLSDVSVENTIIAGLDEIALDSYSLRFLDLKAEDVPFLSMGEKRGIGVTDWKSLDYVEVKV